MLGTNAQGANVPRRKRGIHSLLLRLESLGVFPESGVVFLAPRPTLALLALHRRAVHELADLDAADSLDALLVPGQWTPHCTLAGHLDLAGLGAAVTVCGYHWRPVQGQGDAIGMRVHPSPDNYARADFANDTT